MMEFHFIIYKYLLHYACYFGSNELIRFLLSLNIFDLNYYVEKQIVPYIADIISSGLIDILKLFIEIPSVDVTINLDGFDCFSIACIHGEYEILKILCEKFPEHIDFLSIFMYAGFCMSLTNLKYILSLMQTHVQTIISSDHLLDILINALYHRNYEFVDFFLSECIDQTYVKEHFQKIQKVLLVYDDPTFLTLFYEKGLMNYECVQEIIQIARKKSFFESLHDLETILPSSTL